MPEANDGNRKIIEESRTHDGCVGGQFAGAPLLLLHSSGAKSGRERVTPVMYQRVRGGYAIFASKGGAPSNPDWYYHLQAHPRTAVEVGTETLEVVACEADDDEREPIWEQQKRDYPGFAGHER